jgi:hypothetical protein
VSKTTNNTNVSWITMQPFSSMKLHLSHKNNFTHSPFTCPSLQWQTFNYKKWLRGESVLSNDNMTKEVKRISLTQAKMYYIKCTSCMYILLTNISTILSHNGMNPWECH